MKTKELREKDDQELVELLTGSTEELMNLRFQKATGALENSARIAAVKRSIAQIHTVRTENARAASVNETSRQAAV